MSTEPQGQRIGISPGSSQWAALVSSPYSFAAVGLIASLVAWKAGLNANVFYIALLTTAYAFCQFIVRDTRTRIVFLGLFIFFLFYTPNPGPAMPKVVQFVNATADFRVIPPQRSRAYRFMLQGIRDRAPKCGPTPAGELYIQGSKLDDASLRVPNVQITQKQVSTFYNISRLRALIEFPTGIPAKLDITLVNTGATSMAVKYGPEISGRTVYDEAVYMIFRSDKCVIVAHSMPIVAPQ